MFPGFLPTSRESTFMLDVVVIAMVGVLPVLTWSIYLVRYKRNYALHKTVQVTLGAVLLVAVVLFELDTRLHRGWWDRAKESPFYANGVLIPFLGVHLFFAISAFILWIVTIIGALRRFPTPPWPGEYSRRHLVLGKLAALTMYCTGVTGWVFYWMAFMAE